MSIAVKQRDSTTSSCSSLSMLETRVCALPTTVASSDQHVRQLRLVSEQLSEQSSFVSFQQLFQLES